MLDIVVKVVVLVGWWWCDMMVIVEKILNDFFVMVDVFRMDVG